MKIPYVDIRKKVKIGSWRSGLCSGYVFTIRHVMCPVAPVESTAQKRTEKWALNSIILVINLCLCGNII